MTCKTTIRLLIIVPLLIVFGVGAWIGVNMLVARRMSLIHLVEAGDLDGVKYVCRWDQKQVGQEAMIEMGQGAMADSLYRTPLHIASRRGHADIVQVLVGAGADPRDATVTGDTALHFAAKAGHVAVVRLLLEAGADVNARCGLRGTPLHWAVGLHGPLETWDMGQEHIQVSKVLLKAGVDVDGRDTRGWTALYGAVGYGNRELVELLLREGADINVQSYTDMRTPMSCTKDDGMIEFLRRNGAKTDEELMAENEGEELKAEKEKDE